MKLESRFETTKTGLRVEFRSASESEAELEIAYLKRVCGETRFLLSEPEDVAYTVEGEREYLRRYAENPKGLMLNAYVGGVFVGNGSFEAVSDAKRFAHRATMGVALYREACGQGIGELLVGILIEKAAECGFEILELDVFAQNMLALRLYEKLGFCACGRVRNAVKYQDGTYDDEIRMQCFLRKTGALQGENA